LLPGGCVELLFARQQEDGAQTWPLGIQPGKRLLGVGRKTG
jgi:hypothetical protein